jgi:hypothetical protein
MKLTTILILGSAALATPAFAQAAADSNTPFPAVDQSTNGSTATQSQTTAAAVSSIPDTEKKYKESSRASDDQKEAETTKALNQQIASMNGIPKTQQ